MADIRAQQSKLAAELNKDQPTLRAIVAKSQDLALLPSRVTVTSLDATGFAAKYTIVNNLSAGGSQTKTARITFPKPLTASREVSSTFKNLGQQSGGLWYPVRFGVSRALVPSLVVAALLFGLSKSYDVPALQVTMLPVLSKFPDAPDQAAWLLRILGAIHGGEAALMLLYALHKGASLPTALKWAATQFIVGFPNFTSFQKLNPTGLPPKSKKA